MPIAAPRRQEADIKSKRIGFCHDPIHVPEIVLIGSVGIFAVQWRVAVGVRSVEAVDLGEGDGLNDREALLRAALEIVRRLLAIEPVEQLPRGVAEPEKRPVVRGDEKAAIVANLEHRQGAGRSGSRESRRGNREQ